MQRANMSKKRKHLLVAAPAELEDDDDDDAVLKRNVDRIRHEFVDENYCTSNGRRAFF
jgi:hypothetical protein